MKVIHKKTLPMHKIKIINTKLLTLIFATVMMSGCAFNKQKESDSFEYQEDKPLLPLIGENEAGAEGYYASQSTDANSEELKIEMYPGTGKFINTKAASRVPSVSNFEGEFTLNFEGEEVQEVARLILDGIMHENFVIAPGVSGKVTFSTAKPVNEDQLMSILEMLLGWNGASIVYRENRYLVTPTSKAIKGNLVPRMGPIDLIKGYDVRAIPLQFISPTEMQKLLEPYAKDGSIVSADIFLSRSIPIWVKWIS